MNKNGFTLIELLAVIVILAIIALIAFPTITGIVEKSKMGAVEESANGYNDAINKQIALNLMDANNENDISEGIYDAPFNSKYNIKVKGQMPKNGWIEILKNGVNRYSLVIGDYVVSYDGNEKTVVKGNEPTKKPGTKSFSTDSWATIIAAVRNNDTLEYHVGDTKEVDMGKFGKHKLRIANMSTPSECSTEGFSKTACGFVLEFEDIIILHNMNPSTETNKYGTNKGGWPATSMREYVNSDIFNSLPSDLKDGIVDTLVVSGHGSTSGETNFTSTDKLYLLSTKEVWGKEDTSNVVKYDTAEAETRQLDYYKESGVTTSNYSGAVKKSNVNEIYWRLRSAYSVNTDFYIVSKNGSWGMHYPNNSGGVSPAFRIG